MSEVKQGDIVLKIASLKDSAPWILRVSDNKDGVLIRVFERQKQDDGSFSLVKYGEIAGKKLRACKKPVCYILSEVKDELNNPIGLQSLFEGSITFRGDVPLDKTAGSKMALVAILASVINIEAKAELIAWRIERISAEEAFYWLGKVTVPVFGEKSAQWAVIGLRTMLAGPTDQKVDYEAMLEKLRR